MFFRKENLETKEEKYSRSSANFEGDCSSIQRLKNDENIFGPKEDFNEDLFGYYNLGCAAADLLERYVLIAIFFLYYTQ